MPRIIDSPAVVHAAGNRPKVIEEFIGRVSSASSDLSIARMKSPSGWEEPGQTPLFDEYTVVLAGVLCIESRNATHNVQAGQAVIVKAGEWVKYSTPGADGAEYIAVCLPAFSPETVCRDEHK